MNFLPVKSIDKLW